MKRALFLLACVVTVPALAWALGVVDYVRDIDRLRADVVALGLAAPLVWVLAQSVAEGAGIPSTVPVLAAMLLWEPPTALVVSILGSIGGTCVGFWLARSLAREWVQRRMPDWMRSYERYFTRHAFVAALGFRSVLFLAPGPAAVMGLSRAPFLPCFAGAALGCIPGLALMIFLGPEAVRAGQHAPVAVWWGVGAAVVLAGALYGLHALRQSRRRPAPAAAPQNTRL